MDKTLLLKEIREILCILLNRELSNVSRRELQTMDASKLIMLDNFSENLLSCIMLQEPLLSNQKDLENSLNLIETLLIILFRKLPPKKDNTTLRFYLKLKFFQKLTLVK